jgi:hypothetical protein
MHKCTSDVNGLGTDSTVGELDKHVDKVEVEAIVVGADRTEITLEILD